MSSTAFRDPSWKAALLTVCALSLVAGAVGTVRIGGLLVSFNGVLLLAAAAILGPVEAGLLGLVVATFDREPQPQRARIFNMASYCAIGLAGGAAYRLAGGTVPVPSLVGNALLGALALPLAVAAAVQMLVNTTLIVGIVRVTSGERILVQLQRMFPGVAISFIGYGLLAFFLVVLWVPVGVGLLSVLLVLVPLLGARWAIVQYAEDLEAQEESLQLLVAAIETQRPELLGHSARVARLCALVAERVGYSAVEIGDLRRAGMLHEARVVAGQRTAQDLPDLLVDDLPFLAPAAGLLTAESDTGVGVEPAAVVRAAHEFDLMVSSDGPDRMPQADALARLRRDSVDERVIEALAYAGSRPSADEGA